MGDPHISRTTLLDRASLLVSCCAVTIVALTVLALQTPRLASWLGVRPDAIAYDIGGPIDLPPRFFAASDVTALLFVRANCAVCQETKAMYADVVRAVKATPGARVLAVIGVPVRPEDAAYASELGLGATEQMPVDLASLRLRRVPTLIIVNRDGLIIRSWEGAPAMSERHDFARTVRSFAQR